MAGKVTIGGGGSCDVEHTLKGKPKKYHDKLAKKLTVKVRGQKTKTFKLDSDKYKGKQLVSVVWTN